MVPKIVILLKGDNTPHSQNMMTRLAELLHILMYLHAGFPELYDPVYESIKVRTTFPRSQARSSNCYQIHTFLGPQKKDKEGNWR